MSITAFFQLVFFALFIACVLGLLVQAIKTAIKAIKKAVKKYKRMKQLYYQRIQHNRGQTLQTMFGFDFVAKK